MKSNSAERFRMQIIGFHVHDASMKLKARDTKQNYHTNMSRKIYEKKLIYKAN
ncbi:hypothetical protein C1H46_029451 [Malus baccata]|uniref:Uncharacterized protein n=1 Tax=Malus baccata TaxID=106549 RepID=A0A540LEX6_MALBA|nr:hypothetical protein C1H46_029451 [Malus baccata]